MTQLKNQPTYEELENQLAELQKQISELQLNSINNFKEQIKNKNELIEAEIEHIFQIEEKGKRESELLIIREISQAFEDKCSISNSDLNKAQSVAKLGNWKWDLKTSEVLWSDEMFHIFGINKDDYQGKLGDVIAKVIHPDDLHMVLPSNASEFADKKPIEY